MTDLNLNDVVADVETTQAIPTEEKIKSLASMAREQLQLEQSIEDAEKALKDKKDQLQTLSEFKIPELFNELGLSEFKLSNGLKVKVSPFYSGKITDESAYDWLEENEHGDIIKGEFIVQYRRPDAPKLQAFQALAASMGLSVVEKMGVHAMTLKAFIRSQIESGQPLPRELFNVYTGFKTKIGK